MDWKKLSPWNWFRKEQAQDQQASSQVPVQRAGNPAPASDPVLPADPFQQMHRLFDDWARQLGFPSLYRDWPLGAGGSSLDFFRPRVDIRASDDAYTIEVDMPGVERDDVKVTVDQDTLVIRGEKRQEKTSEKDSYQVVERQYGAFQRMLDLPADSNPEDLQASFRNGVLTIRVARQPEQASGVREIPVD